jgi:predicted dehydrogenase
LEEVLADKSVDGVLVITPNDTHREIVEKAARAGKHVFVEKPIANTVADGRAQIKATSDAGVTLFVGHLARRSSGVRMAKKMIDAGEAGRLIMIEGHIAHNGGLFLTPDQWRWYRNRCPGGPLMQLAVHTVDTFNYLCGRVRSVSAKVGRLATPAEIDDVGLMILEYENGALGYVGTAYTVPSSGFMNIYGTEAVIECGRRGGDVLVRRKSGAVETRNPMIEANPLAEELDEFAISAQTGARPETGGPEGLDALAVILAAIESARRGSAVTTEEILKA